MAAASPEAKLPHRCMRAYSCIWKWPCACEKDEHAGLGAHVGKGSMSRNGCASMGLFSMCMTMGRREHSCCTESLWGGSLRQWPGSSNGSNYSSYFTSLLWSWHQSSLKKKKKKRWFFFSGIWWRTQSLLFEWMNFSSVGALMKYVWGSGMRLGTALSDAKGTHLPSSAPMITQWSGISWTLPSTAVSADYANSEEPSSEGFTVLLYFPP